MEKAQDTLSYTRHYKNGKITTLRDAVCFILSAPLDSAAFLSGTIQNNRTPFPSAYCLLCTIDGCHCNTVFKSTALYVVPPPCHHVQSTKPFILYEL